MSRKVWGLRRRSFGAFTSLVVIAAVGCTGDEEQGEDAESSPAGQEQLPTTWQWPNGDQQNTRYVGGPIDSSSVDQLSQAWSVKAKAADEEYGSYSAWPVVHNGVVYTQDMGSNVYAIDLESGEVLWTKMFKRPTGGPNGLAFANGAIYGATPKTVFALNADKGNIVWQNSKLAKKKEAEFRIAPLVSDGKVYASTGYQIGGGVAYALDAKTGSKVWSFDTVIEEMFRERERAVSEGRGSGGAWNPAAIGPDGSVYFGTGNPYMPPEIGLSHPRKMLYNDSIVKLDGGTGELDWHYQAVPNDFYDWDMHVSPVYTESDDREIVLGTGKMGYVYAFNPDNGELLWKTPVGRHNGRDRDPVKAMRGNLELNPPFDVYPGILGGVETNIAVADGVVYVPIVNMAGRITDLSEPLGTYDISTAKGEMVALDLDSGEVLWERKLPQMALGAATVVNDVVFTTTFDGTVWALNTENGETAWQADLSNSPANAPIAVVEDTLITGTFDGIVAYQLGDG